MHHFIFDSLKLAIQKSVPVNSLLDGLVQHDIISPGERETLRGKKGMQCLIAKLRGKDFQTFTLFVQCILEAGDRDPSVNTCIVNSIRGAASHFDEMHKTNFTESIPRKQYDPGFLDSDNSEEDCSDDGNSSMTSGYVSNTASALSTPASSFDNDPEETDSGLSKPELAAVPEQAENSRREDGEKSVSSNIMQAARIEEVEDSNENGEGFLFVCLFGLAS